MNIPTKVSVATMVVLATILLAGCSATTSANDMATPSTDGVHPTSSAAAEESDTKNGEEAFIKAIAAGNVSVTIVDFIDINTAIIAPDPTTPENADLSGEVTAKFVNSGVIIRPGVGECGYEEALAFTKQHFIDYPEDVISTPEGLRSQSYGADVLTAGLAYLTVDNLYTSIQEHAKEYQIGLWATCPGFGA